MFKGIRGGCALMLAAIGLAASAAPAQVPNDECTSPTAIAGAGTFPFNTINATTGATGQNNPSCAFVGVTRFTHDEWFCWTADCTGQASAFTCGLTSVNTKIAVYDGCQCPATPATNILGCDDNSCVEQSRVDFQAVCGHQYLIQLGNSPGTPPGQGVFQITCQGPCDQQPPANTCCGARPSFEDPQYASGFGGGPILVGTQHRYGPAEFVVNVIDVTGQGSAPLNTNWVPPRFNHPSWTKGNLGQVFGITLDDQGNIYVTHTAIYDFCGGASDAVGFGGPGAIYKLDKVLGTASLFAALPNFPDPAISPATESLPGLGNITFDCAHRCFYVSDFENGKVYRLSTSGAILSTFDHGTPDSGAPGFAPLGERVWAVQTFQNRLYYSIWTEDKGGCRSAPPPPVRNQVWSVGLDGSGDFLPGTDQLEITLPLATSQVYSMPVADIAFSPTGSMMLGQRSMDGDTNSWAHQSKALEYVLSGTSWVPSTNLFTVGIPDSCAGGVDYDYAFGGHPWFTGDALHLGSPDDIYGIQGSPATGGTPVNSILIDMDNNVMGQDKNELGDVEVSCPAAAPPCMTITGDELLCLNGSGTSFTFNFTVNNNSGQTAYWLLLAPPSGSGITISPNTINIPGGLPSGSSASFSVTLSNVPFGQQFCLTLFLTNDHFEQCCSIEFCQTPPDCRCAQLIHASVVCDPATGGVIYTFSLTNLSGGPIEHMFLFPPTGVTFTPNYFNFNPPLANNATGGPYVVTITGATPGSQVCFHLSVHNHAMQECCAIDECITMPDPCSANPCPVDFNHDGLVNSQDFFDFLNAFFGGLPTADFNNNGVTNSQDFFDFLNAFFTGC